MAVDGVGGSRAAEQAEQSRRSADTAKAGAFSSLMKGERAKADGKDLKKGSAEKSDKKDEKAEAKRAASDQSMLDEILGRGKGDGGSVEGKGDGAGGGSSGEGGDEKDGGMSVTGKSGKGGVEGAEEGDGKVAGKGGGEFGEKLRGKIDKKGAASAKGEAGAKTQKGEKAAEGEAAAKSAKGEKAGKSEAAEAKAGAAGGEKAEAQSKTLAGAEVAGKEAAKAEQAKAVETLRKSERGGDAASAARSDDGKTMQEQIAKNMFPGEVPHPFLMQQIEAVQEVKATAPVIPPEIVDKIVAQARFGTNAAGASEFQIQLKDDVFKGAELKVATKDGKVTIELVAKDAESAATFEQKAQEIAKTLTDKGLNVTSVSVTVQQGPSQDAAGGQSKGRDQRERGVGGVGGARRGAGAGAAQEAASSASGLDNGKRTGKDYTA